jgi:hypothetical protein
MDNLKAKKSYINLTRAYNKKISRVEKEMEKVIQIPFRKLNFLKYFPIKKN